MEAAQRYLEAKERFSVGSGRWAMTTALAFDLLLREECDQVAKPEWWNDEGLKALSVRFCGRRRTMSQHSACGLVC